MKITIRLEDDDNHENQLITTQHQMDFEEYRLSHMRALDRDEKPGLIDIILWELYLKMGKQITKANFEFIVKQKSVAEK